MGDWNWAPEIVNVYWKQLLSGPFCMYLFDCHKGPSHFVSWPLEPTG
jgi:hypothetical protein